MCRASCKALLAVACTLPDAALVAAARRSLPAQHPLFRSELAAWDYFQHSQRCHAGLADPASWHEQIVTVDHASLDSVSLDLTLVAGISRRSLAVRTIAGSSILHLAPPRGCRAMDPLRRHHRLAWRPDGRGLALLALQRRTSSTSKLLLLIASWPEQRIGEAALETVELAESTEASFSGLAPCWAPDCARLAVVRPSGSPQPCSIYLVSANRVVSTVGVPDQTAGWAWHPSSTHLAARAWGEVQIIDATTLVTSYFQLPAGWCSTLLWAPLLGPQALLALSYGSDAMLLLDCAGQVMCSLPELWPVLECDSCSSCVGLFHMATCHRVGDPMCIGTNDPVEMHLFSTAEGSLTQSHTLHGPGPGLGWACFSPDGEHLAWVSPLEWTELHGSEYLLRVFHTGSGLVVAEHTLGRQLLRSKGSVKDVMWSEDGSKVGVACQKWLCEEVDRWIIFSF